MSRHSRRTNGIMKKTSNGNGCAVWNASRFCFRSFSSKYLHLFRFLALYFVLTHSLGLCLDCVLCDGLHCVCGCVETMSLFCTAFCPELTYAVELGVTNYTIYLFVPLSIPIYLPSFFTCKQVFSVFVCNSDWTCIFFFLFFLLFHNRIIQ